MAVTDAILPKNMPMQLPTMNKRKKYCPIQHQQVINENKQNKEKLLSYPILCPLCRLHQRKQIKTKLIQFRIYSHVVFQVHIVRKKGFYKTWTFDCLSPKYRGEMVCKNMRCQTKKVSKALRQKLVKWIMINSNVHEYIIARGTLLVTDA